MKPLSERIREDRRLVVLKLLSEQPGYTMNSSVLVVALSHLGVVCTRPEVLDDIDLLQREGLVASNPIEVGNLVIVTLRQRGQAVVDGTLVVPGVARPSPR